MERFWAQALQHWLISRNKASAVLIGITHFNPNAESTSPVKRTLSWAPQKTRPGEKTAFLSFRKTTASRVSKQDAGWSEREKANISSGWQRAEVSRTLSFTLTSFRPTLFRAKGGHENSPTVHLCCSYANIISGGKRTGQTQKYALTYFPDSFMGAIKTSSMAAFKCQPGGDGFDLVDPVRSTWNRTGPWTRRSHVPLQNPVLLLRWHFVSCTIFRSVF